ncbi:hypothetical protein V8F20_012722 [Naviculisporaceae sp. PSN 640]
MTLTVLFLPTTLSKSLLTSSSLALPLAIHCYGRLGPRYKPYGHCLEYSGLLTAAHPPWVLLRRDCFFAWCTTLLCGIRVGNCSCGRPCSSVRRRLRGHLVRLSCH